MLRFMVSPIFVHVTLAGRTAYGLGVRKPSSNWGSATSLCRGWLIMGLVTDHDNQYLGGK